MTSEWRTATVDELEAEGTLLVQDGNHGEYRPRNEEFCADGTAFIRAADIDQARVMFESASSINGVGLARIRKGIGRPGDVLFSHKGTVGKLALVQPDAPAFVCSPQTTFWRALRADILDRRYLYYFMQSTQFREQWESRKGETDMADYVSLTAQRALLVTLPPIGEQRAIARTLGALDEKVELNRKMNHTLEEMASALFKSWFIDFDPVAAKADGRRPSAMNAATAALFPSEFRGEAPVGWRSLGLQELVEINPRRRVPEGSLAPYLDMANAPTSGHAPSEVGARVPGSGARFENGDTLLAKITPCLENGKAAYVDFLQPGQVGWGSTEFIVMRSQAPIPLPFSYLLARLPEFRDHAIQSMTGSSGRQRVAMDSLERWRMWLPVDQRILHAFGALVEPWFMLAGHNARESRILGTLRDSLLPELLSAGIRLKQAEQAVEAAL